MRKIHFFLSLLSCTEDSAKAAAEILANYSPPLSEKIVQSAVKSLAHKHIHAAACKAHTSADFACAL